MLSRNLRDAALIKSSYNRAGRANRWFSEAAAAVYLAVVLAFSQSAYATDGISCTGSITTVGVHGTNRVMVQLSAMNTIVQICDLGQTVGTTFPNTADQCKADYGTLLTAYALGKSVNVFFDNVQSGTNCTNFAAWELAVARWVHLDG